MEMILRLKLSILTKKLVAMNVTLSIVLAEDGSYVADATRRGSLFDPVCFGN